MKRGFANESPKNETFEWYTPPEIFQALGCRFDLDPCAPIDESKRIVQADDFYSERDDGLSKQWVGFVFMNPPYGKHTVVWMRKFCEHGDGIALVFARTDNGWFQELPENAVVLFLRRRVRFIKQDGSRGGNPGAGSMLIGIGGKAVRALANCNLGRMFEVMP